MAPVQEVHNCIDLFWWRQRVVVFGRHGCEVCMLFVAVKKVGMALLSVTLGGMCCGRSCKWGQTLLLRPSASRFVDFGRAALAHQLG